MRNIRRSMKVVDITGSVYGDYKVEELVNTVEWAVGDYLKKEDVESAIRRGITVRVVKLR